MPDITEKYHFTLDHPSLKGHFPGNPVIPGVVILEKVLRTISQQQTSQSYNILMAKFIQPLVPPATLTVHLSEKSKNRFNFKAMTKAAVISSGIIEIKPESHDK